MSKQVKKDAITYTLEFFVIVLGISISCWINEWNSLRNSKKLERAHLIIINNEFKDNKIQFVNRFLLLKTC